ncbi:hypothetical protein LMH87_011223 [Akanthomyces muscarius]|uniref:Uncharacterized protein n=1 Tax=Akanthomyces muscarius TaxID=2231603 RepID=A0A9W8Q9J2_AKAMU|nr:hypothetical protein LMH87_011223 [Akanthomyces muscarius]KAJ4150474.1 hypothetical protein LMH87_011223 [Akanthomyces muscarius]
MLTRQMDSFGTTFTDQELVNCVGAPSETALGIHCGDMGIEGHHPPLRSIQIAKVNTMVCGVKNELGVMCGTVIAFLGGSGQMKKHIKTMHGFDPVSSGRRNLTTADKATARRSLLWYVLSQEWKRAAFLDEPGAGPLGGPIQKIADFLEAKARADPVWRAATGDKTGRFHRSPPATTPRKRGRGAAVPDRSPSPSQGPPPPSKKRRLNKAATGTKGAAPAATRTSTRQAQPSKKAAANKA